MLSATTLVNPLRSLFKHIQGCSDRQRPTARIVWVAGRSVLICSTVVTSIFLGIQRLGGLESLELGIFNQFVQLYPDAAADPRLLIVTITEPDLHRYGWPISDQILAQSLHQLQSYQPRVVGLDLYRDLAKPPGTSNLATELKRENLIAITNIIGEIPPPPDVDDQRVGFNDFTLDADGVLRRNLLFVDGAKQDYYSFALRVTLSYLQAEDISFRYTPKALFLGEVPLVPLKKTSGGYQIADSRGYQILLHYRNRTAAAPTITLSQLLDGKVNPAFVKDKIVLIGTTAPSLKDSIYTPYSSNQNQDHGFQMSGVMIHAQMTSQLLEIAFSNQKLFRYWSEEQEILWLWSWMIVGGVLVWSLKHPLAFGFGGIVCLAAIAGISWGLFTYLIWIPVAQPILGFIAALGLAMGHRLLFTMTRDPLTGLLMKTAFVRHIGRSLIRNGRRSRPATLGVMVLNLDRFQLIDKSLGQPISDRLLLMVVTRIKRKLPRSAKLARISADEFAICVPHTQNIQLTAIADQLQNTLIDPFLLNQQQIVTTVSIGIAVTQDDHTHTPENLLRDAHTAMYRAKSLGKARYEVFAAGMLTETVNKFTLENDLRQGIAAQEFVLYYQPIICLKTGKISGFEALIRWQHPRKGFISPLTFIPLAEETGLIIPLGKWVCQEACRQAYQWQKQFPERPLIISINLSGRQFEQPDLTDQLAQMIQEVGIEGNSLKLEITESMVMGDVEAAIDLMLRLKALGCKLGMDDFGTGYSSLSNLRRFPIDTLKVDKSFVQKMSASHQDHEIVRTIISLGHTLGMDLIAEGVETQEDAEMLRSLNCEFGQGYFWAKPLPPEEATALLQKSE